MTIVCMIVNPADGVLMGADGAVTDPDTGYLAGSCSKILTLPNMSAVIGISGMSGFSNIMQFFLPPEVTDFDGLVDIFAELVEVTYRRLQESDFTAFGMFDSSVVLGGWSESRQQYEGYRVVTYPKVSMLEKDKEQILEPFVLHPMRGGMWSSTGPSEAAMRRFGVTDGPDGEDDTAYMTRMICAARTESGTKLDQGTAFNAGCFVQLAFLQRYQCHSWITHSWPEDEIGRTIDPSLGQPLPEYLMGHYDAQA